MKEYLKTNQENHYIEVSTRYCKGGINWATGKEEARGYYVSVQPIERRLETCGDHQFWMDSYVCFTGYKRLIKAVTRQSAKQLAEAEAMAMEVAKPVIEAVAMEQGLTVIE